MGILHCLYCMNYIFQKTKEEFCYNDKKNNDIETGNYYEDYDLFESRNIIINKVVYYCSIVSFIGLFLFIMYVIYFISYL